MLRGILPNLSYEPRLSFTCTTVLILYCLVLDLYMVTTASNGKNSFMVDEQSLHISMDNLEEDIHYVTPGKGVQTFEKPGENLIEWLLHNPVVRVIRKTFGLGVQPTGAVFRA